MPRDELAPVAEEVITEFLAEVAPELQAKVTLPGLGGHAWQSNTTGASSISAKFASLPLDNGLAAGIASNNWFADLPPEDMSAVIKASLDGIDNRTSDPREKWLPIIFAVADAERLGCPNARELAREWSQRGKGWDGDQPFDLAYNSYKYKPDGVGVGSLLARAREAGVDLSRWRPRGHVIHLPATANDNSTAPGSRMSLKGGTYTPEEALALFNEHFLIAEVEGAVPIARLQNDGSISYLARSDFDLLVSNIKVRVANAKGTRDVSGAQFWIQHPRRRQCKIVFRPDGNVGPDEHNLWQGFAVTPVKGWGKQRRIQKHIFQIICRRDKTKFKYLMKWLAWSVQHPGERAETVIVLQSRAQGTGKTTLSTLMRDIFGKHGRVISSKLRLLSQFNADLETTCWVSGEEMLWHGDKGGADALKSVITGDTITLEIKNGARWDVPNRLHILMTTNHEHAIAAGVHERRHFVLEVSDERAQEADWFDPLHRDLSEGGKEQFLWLLQNLQLGNWHPRRLPKTAEAVEQQRMSADSVSQWASACIEADAIVTGDRHLTLPLSSTIETNALLSSYSSFCRQQGKRCADERSFGRKLAAMFGKDARTRLPAQSSSGRRPWGYAVPDAETWRNALDKYLGI